MTRIVIAVDGSENSIAALTYVAQRKRKGEDIEASIIHVQPKIAPKGTLVTRAMIDEYQAGEAEKALGKAKIKALQKALRADIYVEQGEPASAIIAFARKTKCDEIVVGGRGASGIKGLIMGSIASKVAQMAPIPVVIVK
jgi:nucleotide-binding universal stress UspA family protein